MRLISIVLSGGVGARLWPLSRRAFPKPFLELGGSTLLQQAIERGQACGAEHTLVVTHKDHQFLTREVMGRMASPEPATLMLEPEGRNTAVAIALAALQVSRQCGEDTAMLVLPADHLVPDTHAFSESAKTALRLAQQGSMVAWGVRPTVPDTSFSYLEVDGISDAPQPAKAFIAHVDTAAAQNGVATGRHYWYSGMLCCRADAVIAAFQQHAPQLLDAARALIEAAKTDADVVQFDPVGFASLPNSGFEQTVLAHATNIQVLPTSFGWSDVGTWPALARAATPDGDGNTLPLDAIALDTTGTHVTVESHGPKIVATLGVQNLVVVDTPDALLIASKDSAPEVDRVVQILRERKHETIDLPAVVHRPWGTYASLKEEDGYKVKRITVKPGQALSLQYHHKRAEHWVVVRGTAIVQVGDVEYKTQPGEYRYIPLKERHRLTNIGNDELVLVEVQCGSYLGEDDIVRLVDTYGRV